MVSKSVLEKYHCTPAEWRKKLEYPPTLLAGPDHDKPPEELKPDEKLESLRRMIRSRVEAGRQHNLTNYRTYQALDTVWNSAFRQVTPTIMLDFIRNYDGKTTEEITSALKSMGLDSTGMWIDGTTMDPKTSKPTQILNPPVFTSVVIPLVSAYLLIRLAKLFNDRNINPFIKIESLINSVEDRTRCEVLTARIQTMVEQYGMVHVFKQALFMMLLYGQAMQFTLEEWHFEQQCKYASPEDVAREKAKTETSPENGKPEDAPDSTYGETSGSNGETKPAKSETKSKKKGLEVGDDFVYTVREGLRYTLPHPARAYWDFAHPQWTLNTDTGCEYAGHWRVIRWKEIRDNPDFYNKTRVSWGGQSAPWETNLQFFNSVYNYCVMDWPKAAAVAEDAKDREALLAANSLYNESHGEQSVVVTEHREKIIPKNVGLGDYPYPIWARFLVAGDGTIVYAAPCCYQPVIVFRDNGDDRKTQDASLGLKLIGFQDQVSNLITQQILAARQNLANLTLVDKNVVPDSVVDKIQNLGERFIRGLNFFNYDSKALIKMFSGGAPSKAIESFRFPQLDTNGLILSIRTIIDLAERVLQFSSQEVAQAASHEQTKAEMDLIRQSSTNILKFTGHPADDGLATQARQIYEALMAYGDDDFYASIPYEKNLNQEDLKKLGITYVAEPSKSDKKVYVRAKRSALLLWAFGHAPAPDERKDNIEAARLMSELVRDWFMNNPVGLSALGPDQLVDMANHIAKLAGLPFDRPLRNASMTTEQQNQAAQQQLKSMADAVLTDVKKGMVPMIEDIAQIKQAIGMSNDPRIPPGGSAPGQGAPAPSMAIPA